MEAVVITTRHDSHAYYVIEALKRDKHVFVEKPLCLTREELKDITKVAYKSAGTLMVGYNRRFSKPVQLICEHFKGRIEPLTMSYRVNAGRILRKSEMGWVHDPAVGGGRIIGEVCHFIDTLQAISGASPVSINAYGVVPAANSIAENDIVTITIRFNDGSLATIHYWANGDPGYPKERLEVFGQEKIAVLNNYRSIEMVAAGRTRKKTWFNIQKGFTEEANAFLKACCTGEPPISLDSLFDTSIATITATEDMKTLGDKESR
ncbi:Myo-inositol 2-dehydrogenase [subsurface metagenome]